MAAQDLCSLTDVRQALEIPTADTSRDAVTSVLITQASEAIMGDVGREFAPATASATRRFRVDSFHVKLDPYDLRSTTTVTLHPESTSPQTLVANTDFQLLPIGSTSGTFTTVALSALLTSLTSSQTAFNFGYALLDIAGAWGFAAVPDEVKRAAIVTVSAWLRKDVPALALGDLDLDFGRGGLAPALTAGFAIPKAAKELLGPYYPPTQWVS